VYSVWFENFWVALRKYLLDGLRMAGRTFFRTDVLLRAVIAPVHNKSVKVYN